MKTAAMKTSLLLDLGHLTDKRYLVARPYRRPFGPLGRLSLDLNSNNLNSVVNRDVSGKKCRKGNLITLKNLQCSFVASRVFF